MEKKEKKSVAAVIDIGSNTLRMEIAQVYNGKIKQLENLKYPLSLGRDTFASGRISFEKVNKTCETINHFLTIAKGYGIEKVNAVATTAVREAKNCVYFIDQIKLRTGLTVTVLDDSAEKMLIYREIVRRLKMLNKSYKTPCLMVYIGVGNLGVSILDKDTIPFTQNIRIGTLRLSELLMSVEDYEEHNSIVIDDYLRAFTENFYDILPKGEIKHFIASGRDIESIAAICGETVEEPFISIPREKFKALHEALKSHSIDEIMEEYSLSQENAELLRIAVSIYSMLFNATTAAKIVAPIVYIADALLFDLLYPKEARILAQEFAANTIYSAKALAAKYHYDEEHASYVEKYSLKMFDKLKKIHGLSERDRLYLQVAAILHDVGKYINITSHYLHSYSILYGSEIVGLDQRETELIANITKYHSTIIPNETEASYLALNASDQLVVSKLTAILRIAEALDKGHIKKFDDIDLKLKDNTLFIGINTLMNTQIEEWSFASKRLFFEEVYGMKVKIKKKKVL